MIKAPEDVAAMLLRTPFESLDEHTKKVARHIAARKHIARVPPGDLRATTSLGQRAADAVAAFGGSWTFIGIFLAVLILWVGLNSFVLVAYDKAFDLYPYTFLNLILSMLAAAQAPVILMSQNRQGERDRLSAGIDYEINLKAELEIMLLHEKIDLLREGQWADLLVIQKEQLRLLGNLNETISRLSPHDDH